MILNINTESISDSDKAIMRFLLGEVGLVNVEAAAAEPTPAKKAATSSKKAEPEPEPPTAAEPTVDDAVKLAMELVADGKSAGVKAIVEGLAAPKVSELEGEEIQKFIDAATELRDSSI